MTLDLCRLLNPGGRQPNLVIGLLEIVLEQQKWTRLSPFAAPEGTQVRMEMYVGRRQEARGAGAHQQVQRACSPAESSARRRC